MKKLSPVTLIGMALTLLLACALMAGCAATQGGGAAEAELSDSTVRVPPGDPTEFWDEFGWADMTKAEQALWGVLGWDEDSWEGEAKAPASEDKYWNQLSPEEQDACTRDSWLRCWLRSLCWWLFSLRHVPRHRWVRRSRTRAGSGTKEFR